MKNYGKIQTDKDVTTKQYVDNKNGLSQDDADARYLKLSGGTLSGGIVFDHLALDSEPISFKITNDNFIPTAEDNGTIRFGTTGIVPDGTLISSHSRFKFNYPVSMDNHKIENISAPTELYDATNKKYVDDIVSSVSSTATSAQTKATEALTKATSAETKATAAQNALANKQDKITGTANKLVGINASGVAAVTDTFTINGPITIGNVRIQYNSSTKSLDFVPIS